MSSEGDRRMSRRFLSLPKNEEWEQNFTLKYSWIVYIVLLVVLMIINFPPIFVINNFSEKSSVQASLDVLSIFEQLAEEIEGKADQGTIQGLLQKLLRAKDEHNKIRDLASKAFKIVVGVFSGNLFIKLVAIAYVFFHRKTKYVTSRNYFFLCQFFTFGIFMLISALLVAGVGFLQISPVQPPEMDLSTTPSNAELNAMMEVLRKDKAKIVNQLYAVLILYLFSLTLVLSALICRLHVVYAAFNPSRKGTLSKWLYFKYFPIHILLFGLGIIPGTLFFYTQKFSAKVPFYAVSGQLFVALVYVIWVGVYIYRCRGLSYKYSDITVNGRAVIFISISTCIGMLAFVISDKFVNITVLSFITNIGVVLTTLDMFSILPFLKLRAKTTGESELLESTKSKTSSQIQKTSTRLV